MLCIQSVTRAPNDLVALAHDVLVESRLRDFRFGEVDVLHQRLIAVALCQDKVLGLVLEPRVSDDFESMRQGVPGLVLDDIPNVL